MDYESTDLNTEVITGQAFTKHPKSPLAKTLAISPHDDEHLRTILEAWPSLTNDQKQSLASMIRILKKKHLLPNEG